jgi:hypothetical protein
VFAPRPSIRSGRNCRHGSGESHALCSIRAGGGVEFFTGRPSSRHLQDSTAGSAVNGAQREQSCRSESDEASTHPLTAREGVLSPWTVRGTPQSHQAGTMQPDGWEAFFGRHQHTISAIEALSTFAVVVLSLVLALISQRASRTRAKAFVEINAMHHANLGDRRPAYVTVSIQNAGLYPLSIPLSFFCWYVPFEWEKPLSRRGWSVIPWDYSQEDPLVPQKRYPVEIKPRGSEMFFLADAATFHQQFEEIFAATNRFQRVRFRFLKARIVTDDGKLFNVKFGRVLQRRFRELLSKAGK